MQGLKDATKHELNMGVFAAIESLLPYLKDIVVVLSNDQFTLNGKVILSLILCSIQVKCFSKTLIMKVILKSGLEITDKFVSVVNSVQVPTNPL